jgi:catechol 2,3-dioxygenase-like lactoylglutathione lyase family enzyme
MPPQLNHTIISARDQDEAAAFLTEILGLPGPSRLGHFTVVQVGETSLDFVSTDEPIACRHFAFLVSEGEFDEIFGRIRGRGMSYWADPFHRLPERINTYDDGRGLYFEDPNGHNLEILTRSYGSGGLNAKNPNPLLKATSGNTT